MPLLGIGVVKAAQHLGLVGTDALYQFVLMLQYALPPAMAVGTYNGKYTSSLEEDSSLIYEVILVLIHGLILGQAQ